jgi:two-component system, cell cycle sensor histidine kinase and response regulator CckA
MKKNRDLNLLLIEDNRGDARLILEMLKESKLGHYECTVAENLTLAFSQLEHQKFDIMILDLNLPESSGIETLDRIIGFPGVMPPIIVLTGLDDETIGVSAIERGAEDYLVKGSINAAQLSRSIRYAVERTKLARALRESEEIFRQFMEHSPVYVFFKDEQLKSLRLSKNFESMLGKPLEELLGKTMEELFPSDLAGSMAADDLRILKEGKRIDIEEVLNGRTYNTIKFPIQQEGGLLYVAGFTIDITEQKHVEETLRNQLDELRRWQEVMMGREGRVIELKKEVNGLLREQGRTEKYDD